MTERLLLDTNILVWILSDSKRISARARRAISRPRVALVVSIVSVWEIILKNQAGKLELKAPVEEVANQIMYHSPWTMLPVGPEHLLALAALPLLHRDPFDRLLVAQARQERLTIVTADENVAKYDIRVVW